jgi:hypothetical protein
MEPNAATSRSLRSVDCGSSRYTAPTRSAPCQAERIVELWLKSGGMPHERGLDEANTLGCVTQITEESHGLRRPQSPSQKGWPRLRPLAKISIDVMALTSLGPCPG